MDPVGAMLNLVFFILVIYTISWFARKVTNLENQYQKIDSLLKKEDETK